MSRSMIRVVAVVALAAAGFSCAENPSGLRRLAAAAFALSPTFAQAPAGGPEIDIERVRGVLRSGSDSAVAEARVQGDTAVLEFVGVPVSGDSTRYQLQVQAFDSSKVVVFQADQTLQVKPGNNAPASPVLQYVAPDAAAATIDIPDAQVQLDWAGALEGDRTCLNRAPKTNAVTQRTLSVVGRNAAGQTVPAVRVGWTSRDTLVATVNENGVVRARCSNKSTWVVARTFLNKSDSVQVIVSAPPFSLMMSPDSADVRRGSTAQLTAQVVDENGNTVPASQVTWVSSNTARATVSATGQVTGITNGRVLITARAGERTTVGVVHVIRPLAAKVLAIPKADTVALGTSQVYYAKAADANNRIIGDATEFTWGSSAPAIAKVNAAGVVTAVDTGTAHIVAKIDGKSDTIAVRVETTRPGGSIKSRILDAATNAPLADVRVEGPNANFVLTNANGEFQLGNLQPGVNVVVSKTGYVTDTLFDAPVFRNYVLDLPEAGLPPASTMAGSLSGTAVNALNGATISGVTVQAYRGLNAAPSPKRPEVKPVATATSNSSGVYTFPSLVPGVYTLRLSATGYSDNLGVATAVGGQARTAADVLLPPSTAGAGLVVVLTWGPNATNVPADLDAHMTGPDGGTGRFHVYTGLRAFVSGPDTIAALELDVKSYKGPEVVTLRSSAGPGTYRFFVHNFSGRTVGTSKALADSASARVDVYQGNRVIGTFFPPAGQAGTLWKVFEFDGARLFPVNQITHQEDATILPMVIGDSDVGDVSRIFRLTRVIRKGQ